MEPCWDDEADIVVAGGGDAGLMAALTAAEAGAKVILIEKAERIGGKSAIAIGSFTASETTMQRAAGITDSHAEHLEDLMRLGQNAGLELNGKRARLRIEEDNKSFHQLLDMGIAFSGPHPEAPHRKPRMHNIKPSPATLVDVLHERVKRAGVAIRTRTPIADVLLDGRGRIVGVVAGGPAGSVRLRAGAVVLAAGDCISDPAMLRRFSPQAVLAGPVLPQYTGEPFLIAMRIGAQIVGSARIARPLIRAASWPHVEPSHGLFKAGAVMLDRSGKRHTDELLPPSTEVPSDEELFVVLDERIARTMATAADDTPPSRDGWQRTGKAYIGTTPAIGYAYLEDCKHWIWYFEAPSIAAAAKQIRCPESALADLVGRDAVPPFQVLGPFKRMFIKSKGALASDDMLRVVDADNQPIAGLYAAGDTTAWFEYVGGHGYGISWAVTSGRLAGKAAAAYRRGVNG